MDRTLLAIAALALAPAALTPMASRAQPASATGIDDAPQAGSAGPLAPDLHPDLAQAPAPDTPAILLAAPEPRADAPEVEVPAKPEWSDDEGFRLTFTKLAYRQRF